MFILLKSVHNVPYSNIGKKEMIMITVFTFILQTTLQYFRFILQSRIKSPTENVKLDGNGFLASTQVSTQDLHHTTAMDFKQYMTVMHLISHERLIHTELRQRKYFFLQEWVTLVSMELFTWRPAAKATAKVSSSIGFYAQL